LGVPPGAARMNRSDVTETDDDERRMRLAIDAASAARRWTSPNPWVGCVVVTRDGRTFSGATAPVGGPHAEVAALQLAGEASFGATLYVTLEPCCHHGRTPPCTEAIVRAGVARVVVGVLDPDQLVAGRGVKDLRAAGIEVDVGVLGSAVEDQLRAYLHHRRTGRPFVVLKIAATMDGRTAASDGSSQWITSIEARTRVHEWRAESDAILVGAATIRADDPALTVRLVEGRNPHRIVLGTAPSTAQVHPCTEWTGSLEELLDTLGRDGVLQLMVEGGASVASTFHHEGLVDRYIVHLAPAFIGGDDGRPMFVGPGVPHIEDVWRGSIVSVQRFGPDVEIVLEPERNR
jgi:diaminohydroxyphosphoribosylaminopyrimidine deaminase / 5-amino-6-(5-phosphoribosylamino)uracil reductase